MLCAIINDYMVTAVEELSDTQYAEKIQYNQMIIDITNTIPKPKATWLFDGMNFFPPLGWDETELITQTVYDPMVEKFKKIRRRFIGENIAWGINQTGKTEAVADFMETIEKWFNRAAPLVTIKYIEIAKAQLQADPELSANLTPFVTVDRLNWYKIEILKSIGMA